MHNKRLRRAVFAVAVTALSAAGVPAAAEPVSAFYFPPAQLPAEPGAIVKTQPMPVFAAPPGAQGGWPVAARQVMYTSRTQNGEPVAVSGTYLEPTQPWLGSGPRPTVVIAPGTAGQGDQCAVSVAFSTGLAVRTDPLSVSANQEAISAAAWGGLGARVFVTDYIGLGTPGIHTYVNRVESAHAVLDAARAADALAGTAAPLVFWGYSQGGGAVAAAAELQPEYAPELNLKGTWAGGPVADLAVVLAQIDGNLIGGAIGFAINGFTARYPELRAALDERTTPAGRALLDRLSTSCIGDVILQEPFARTDALTVDGRPLLEHLRSIPGVERVLGDQRIGNLRPTTPVLITSGRNDDTVPYSQARQLATDWCAQGSTITFRTNELPPIAPGTTIANHFGPELIDGFGTNNAISYLIDRLNENPLQGCTFN
ncbi:secretory lipase [Nocardia tenerifensis]|uniref:Secretory lipase n=1 Tax=Nocardia tenerifensis TaxID=228006 RepID=A0A318JWM2_9NOCA|nr:lipase family protein [Nocardia tenerifensis]PXX61680.1 secretory lipase [Nocardia tenerifensis]